MGRYIDDPALEQRAKNPRHRGFAALEVTSPPAPTTTVAAMGENPFCGDELEVRLVLRRDGAGEWVVERAAFDGYGCTLCLAAADVVMEHLTGLPVKRAAVVDFEDTCRLLGGLEVGRTRRGCVDLAARVVASALASCDWTVSEACGSGLAGASSERLEANDVDKRPMSLSY